MTELHLARDLALPLDAVTRATAIVGQRGTGKTSTAVVFVEEAAAAGAHFAVIDPTGAWYGLTSNMAGTGAGLDCVVMGGHNGDVPLESESGQVVARLVVEERYSVVLDLETMSKSKQVQFVAQFCEELYHRNRAALTLVVDEAHRFAPQQLRDTERGGYGARCLGAVTDVATLGRRKGLGAVVISQRPAKINKDVFEECEVVIAHRLMGTNDRKAIAGWLEEKDEEAKSEASAALSKLRTLKQGHALVYAPTMDVFGDFLIRRKRTFDSSATPEIGGEVVLPQKRSEIDLTALEQRMADTLERAKKDDPKELKRQIRELQSELAKQSETEAERVEVEVRVPVAPPDLVPKLTALWRRLEEYARETGALGAGVSGLLQELRDLPDGRIDFGATGRTRPGSEERKPGAAPVRRLEPRREGSAGNAGGGRATRPAVGASSNGQVSGPQQRVLDALAWLHRVGFDRPSKTQVGFIAGYRVGKKVGGTFGNVLGQLHSADLIAYPTSGAAALTDAGRQIAVEPDIEQTTEGLQGEVFARLNDPERRVLRGVVDVYPEALTKQEAGERAGYAVGEKVGGTFGNVLGRLRSLGLVEYPAPGYVAAESILFLD